MLWALGDGETNWNSLNTQSNVLKKNAQTLMAPKTWNCSAIAPASGTSFQLLPIIQLKGLQYKWYYASFII